MKIKLHLKPSAICMARCFDECLDPVGLSFIYAAQYDTVFPEKPRNPNDPDHRKLIGQFQESARFLCGITGTE
jgi:hypothetical protein